MIHFAKAHAYGNDFLYVLHSAVPGADLAQLARDMCERHTGIGADGLIVYAETAPAGASMRLFNADGSRAEVSGNGVRALAALLLRDRPDTDAAIDIATEGGTKRLTRTALDGDRQTFRAAMGSPADITKLLPMEVAGESLQPVILNIGNPQCVVLGALPERARFERLGAALERHAIFPDGANVEFADVEAPDRIRILIWERGVGPTSSSGTGSCAALVAAASFGGAARDAAVIAPGGAQRVEWLPESVYLTGWAEVVCEGVWLRQIPRRREPG
jgi:diaminopimelate epimerase